MYTRVSVSQCQENINYADGTDNKCRGLVEKVAHDKGVLKKSKVTDGWFKRFLERQPTLTSNGRCHCKCNNGLPEQLLKGLVGAQGSSKCGWSPYKYKSTLLSEIGKYTSHHSARRPCCSIFRW